MDIFSKRRYRHFTLIIALILIEAFLVMDIAWAGAGGIISQKHQESYDNLSPQISISAQDIKNGFLYFSQNNDLASQSKIAELQDKDSTSHLGQKIGSLTKRFASFMVRDFKKKFLGTLVFAGLASFAYATDGIIPQFHVEFTIGVYLATFAFSYITACGISVLLKKIITKYSNLSPKKFRYIHGFLTLGLGILVLNSHFYYFVMALFSSHIVVYLSFIAGVYLYAYQARREYKNSIYEDLTYDEIDNSIVRSYIESNSMLIISDAAMFLLLLGTAFSSSYLLAVSPIIIVAVKGMFNEAIRENLREMTNYIEKTYGDTEEFLRKQLEQRSDAEHVDTRRNAYLLKSGAAGPMAAASIVSKKIAFHEEMPVLGYHLLPWWLPSPKIISKLRVAVKDKSPRAETQPLVAEIGNPSKLNKILYGLDDAQIKGFIIKLMDFCYGQFGISSQEVAQLVNILHKNKNSLTKARQAIYDAGFKWNVKGNKYNKIYMDYKKGPRYDLTFNLIKDYIDEGDCLADVGCGNNNLGVVIVNNIAGTKVIGCDVYKESKDKPHEKVDFVLQKQEDKIPLADKSVDKVLFSAVLHHATPEIAERLLSEAKRVVKDDGQIIIIEDVVLDTVAPEHTGDGLVDELKALDHAKRKAIISIFDWFANHVVVGGTGIPMGLNYQSEDEWQETFSKLGLSIIKKRFVGISKGKFHAHPHTVFVLKKSADRLIVAKTTPLQKMLNLGPLLFKKPSFAKNNLVDMAI